MSDWLTENGFNLFFLPVEEDMADNGGLRAAFNAFSHWMHTREDDELLALPGLTFTQHQLFFLSFAQVSISEFLLW